jgi:mannose-6-phosphate isomerase-like protein (cupin superfamily)
MHATDLRLIDMSNADWQPFDPKAMKSGPYEYPEDLTGVVQWVRTFDEGPQTTGNGEVGLSLLHMRGDPTDWLEEKTNEETEIMIFLEGSAEARLADGRVIEVKAPQIVYAPRGLTYDWRYTSPYRGVYVLLW